MHSLPPAEDPERGSLPDRFPWQAGPRGFLAPEENPLATHHTRLHTGMMRGRRLHHAIEQTPHRRDKTAGNCRYYPCPYAGRRLAAGHHSPRELAYHHDRPAAPRPCSPRAPSLKQSRNQNSRTSISSPEKRCRDMFPAQPFLLFFRNVVDIPRPFFRIFSHRDPAILGQARFTTTNKNIGLVHSRYCKGRVHEYQQLAQSPS